MCSEKAGVKGQTRERRAASLCFLLSLETSSVGNTGSCKSELAIKVVVQQGHEFDRSMTRWLVAGLRDVRKGYAGEVTQ